jgi:hypothetical protein
VTVSAVAGRSPEQTIAYDITWRALLAAPLVVAVAGLVWGLDGALSALFALGLVVGNFLLSAALLTWCARISPHMLMVGALGGFIVRLGIITVAVLAIKDAGWVDLVALGVTIIVTHLGLLVWETRYISASLAHPVLKPKRARPPKETKHRWTTPGAGLR